METPMSWLSIWSQIASIQTLIFRMNPDQAQIEMAKQTSLEAQSAAVGPLGMTKEEMDLQ